MQRYRPDIAWPRVGDPWPMMAEDSELGQYYAKEDVDLEIDRLNKKCAALARLVYPTHPDPTGKSREPPHCPSCSCGLHPKGDPHGQS